MAQGPVTRGERGTVLRVAPRATVPTAFSGGDDVPSQRSDTQDEQYKEESLDDELRRLNGRIRRWVVQDGLSRHVDEIAQNALVRVYQARTRPDFAYRQADGGVGFAYQCTQFAIRDFWAERKKEGERRTRFLTHPEPRLLGEAEDGDLGRLLDQQALRSFLEQHLPDKEREVYWLRHYREMQLREIAAFLKIDRGTVRARLQRAEERLTHVRDDLKD
ncbi:RNA polymerase sigma factor [Streptomyces boluensis]|uniref:Sigma-70 family RNA polymerase sigma factor n=1 Tax=Streptomyces boluensis TaxID=1775135 RepID=A0A964URS3_9ACTN|nr:sigma-70 family RNA polymerase sigma factor [Streptomyces boluensis]NBE53236.1 sigma-70 family RNA polymerase sigma factor [Streptomyces boluensis]